MELVSVPPYFSEADYLEPELIDNFHELQLAIPKLVDEEPGSLMLVQAPMRTRQPAIRKARPCFGCGGNHWLRICPDKLVISYKGEKLPLVERYCIGCCVDHLPKVCPHKPPLTTNPRPNQGLNYIEVIPLPYVEEEERDSVTE